MNRVVQPAAIRKTLVLKSAAPHAFEVFTAGFGRWWPVDHFTGTSSPLVTAIIEPRVGGRWYGRHADGSELPWGDVLVWEPSTRLILAWRITHEWGYDPQLLTEVEVRFTDLGDGRTRVDFEHRHLERFGDSPAAIATIESMTKGWGMILERYQAEAERAPHGAAAAHS